MKGYCVAVLSSSQLILLVIVFSLHLVVGEDQRHDVTESVRAEGNDVEQVVSPTENSDKNATELKSKSVENATSSEKPVSNAVLLYRRLFKQKREAHKDAIKSIIAMGSYEKQYKMIQMLFTKMFTILTKSRVQLTEAGYTPGDQFPTTDHIKEALSTVLENIAFVGDILLRLPDITHNLLKANPEWNLTVQWGIGFCNDTLIFTGSDSVLLYTMAQELELIEKDPDYLNPYRSDTMQSKIDAEMAKEKLDADAVRKAQKLKLRKEKKKLKGPRMSSPRRDEL
jgi:hypothetical protein